MAAYRDSGPGGDADVLRHAGTNLLDAESVSYNDHRPDAPAPETNGRPVGPRTTSA
jgi:hypothetical protein